MSIRAAKLAADGQTVENVILVPSIEVAADLVTIPVSEAVQIGWRLVGESFVPPTLAPPGKADLLAYSASRRWARERGGTTVGALPVPTDERTQAVLTAAFVQASADPGFTVDPWKVGPGSYVSLSAAEIIAISAAVNAHVQACFALNATVDAAILAGTITTYQQIDAAYAP